ncbi:hypothetical protein [Micromonospora inyonensis]|uniref:Phage terminase-like protein, large subunit, contains N-terminal HTH domain n=1 Tax=Micromonospora inyonensis TaxID=47866 RepID=A0A1C6RWU0_9ACTN|nr:hypothetical protein [Micromonospora inyonensis]SCL21678.1 hypothetical protein GA0074694_3110 [Micromonospora inyonensis]
MPWRGPNEEGEFPTLGYDVGEWIEDNVVVPDGYQRGEPYRLTDEMWRFLVHYYRLYPHAGPWPAPDALRHYGGQLRRSQKWGKDPFGAAIILAEALGPTRFDGWNADGEPVGAPYPTPLIVCLGTSEDQTDNTWRPLLSSVRNGPLINLSGIDAGETKVTLPGGGKIEPVTTSAKSRLGAPLTFLTITESHLFTLQGGYRKVCGAVKRNVAGMDGRWLELTNAWDPTEGSEAQVTAEAKDDRIYVDTVEPKRVDDLADDEALYAELLRQYGDSARERGGWVNIRGRIVHEVRSSRHMEADRRRFFLNEIVVGESVFVDPVRWDLFARDDQLRPGDGIALGFDGSKYRDATALVASRLSDGRLFELGVWERPADAGPDWKVPSAKVDERLREVFSAYEVALMFADPYRWQDYLNAWAAEWPGRVVEFPTNVEQRMDKAIERFTTGFAAGQITHDGSETLGKHCKNAVLVKGSRKKPRPGEEQDIATHYLKMAKRGEGMLIDAAVATVLAHAARGRAIEDGALTAPGQTEVWAEWLDV